ncbi:Bcr/CflA family multidrug efflux MFS transporter [Saccharopolyspora dendranthemae]|uniref:DHA1 family bicyclomycin/chloramphenicol resistance-like MFS transporter n=1 Tax=Saccharopolyspora dendranthemae TaxID=1181886 RepID=A0A561U9Y5_9PSEU|nr:Bcr/CflA family multidrug efflux MFS transporter [Saccharopolyspora dendranthemae]TWF96167.1 DHA1 family bicyclomycin/chloramphenicol resistance-like MFS transporter [Saccharopolyspora dendranthemae]
MAERSRLKYALILGGMSAFGPLSMDMYLPALPAISGELHAGPSQVQLSLMACTIGLALGQLVMGPLSDAHGRRRPMLIGVVVFALASLACALAPSAYALAALRFVQGFGGAAGIVIARAVVRDLFSGVALAKFFSLLMLVNGVVPVLAPVLGGQLLRFTSWRGVFVTLCAIGAALLIAAVLALPETLPREYRRPGNLPQTLRTFGVLLRDRLFVGFALSASLAFAAMFAYISGSSFVLQNVHHLSPQMFSVVFGVNSIGIVTMGQVNGLLVGKVDSRRLLAIGLGCNALGGISVAVSTVLGLGLVPLLAALFVTVASIGLVFPNATALALSGHRETAGSASALLGVLQFMIGGLVSPLVGIAGSNTAVPMGVVMGALSVSAVVVFAVLARRRVEPEVTRPAERPS